ncbi:hypothetical protein [Rhodoferax sp. GW822-FHT02A01]|uniref:hypothetical protein n=1 Tax=Rhodoferax sp. GW822-FHT02A01 TaxID=3141537 RepID=UPI00315DA85E
MTLKKIYLASAFLLLSSAVHATDIFASGKPVEMSVGAEVKPDFTVGGYSIYQGAGNWRLFKSESSTSSARGEATSVNLGWVSLFELVDPQTNAYVGMDMTVNLSSGGPNDYWTGNPCAGVHLAAVNKAQGQDDNCMTIDVKAGPTGSKGAENFIVRSTQSASSGRLFAIAIALPIRMLGLPDSSDANWTSAAVEADPAKAAVLNRVKEWAVQLQDASRKAIGFSKPQDAFAAVPSYRTLMKAPVSATNTAEVSN